MSDEKEVKVVTVDRPVTAHGWLRRPELDRNGINVWEKPDGTLYAAEPGFTPVLVTLTATNRPRRLP